MDNLNEQLQEAIRAGRRQGLSENSRIEDLFGGAGGAGRGGRFGGGPVYNDGGFGGFPGHGAGGRVGKDAWLYALRNGKPPMWWNRLTTGNDSDWLEFIRPFMERTRDISEMMPDSDIDGMFALFMRALYTPNNKQLWGDLMNHEFMQQLRRQGWYWSVDPDDGYLEFAYDVDTFGIPDPNDPLHQWAERFSEMINRFPFG